MAPQYSTTNLKLTVQNINMYGLRSKRCYKLDLSLKLASLRIFQSLRQQVLVYSEVGLHQLGGHKVIKLL